MSDDYRPDPGTTAHDAIEHLKAQAPKTLLGTSELARAIGRGDKVQSLYSQLALCVRFGLLRRERSDGGAILWGLGHRLDATIRKPDDDGQLRLSADAVPSVWAYAESRGAPPFSLALSTDGRLAIERHGRVVCELTNDERLHLLRTAAAGVTPPAEGAAG